MNKKTTELPIDLRTIDANILVKKLEQDMRKRELLGEDLNQETDFKQENEEDTHFISTKMKNDSLHEKMLNKYTHAKKRNKLLR